MKKVLYTLAGMAMIALGAVSCQKETSFEAGKDGSVTFTVNLPGVETKAISDGTTAKKLDFAIYDGDGKYLKELSESATVSTFSGKKATVTVQVIKDLTYQFVFFAEAETGSPYTFAPADKKLSIAYGAANLEAADAFYYATERITVEGAFSRNITLTRPLAQINFGSSASDIAAAELSKIDVDGLKSSLILTSVYSEMDLLTGELTGEPAATVTLTEAAKPAETIKVKDVDYGWIAMAYILAGDKEVTDLTLGVKTTADGKDIALTREVANVPYQRNHRTNILGNIFSYTASFNIEIDSNFDEEEYIYNIPAWSGTDDAELDLTKDEIIITTGEELAQLATLVNGGTSFAGKTVKLGNDINLASLPWTPIGTTTNVFTGSFDGQGHIVSNLKIEDTEAAGNAGLFGKVASATLENFSVDGVTITANNGSAAGAAIARSGANVTIKNINVKNVTITAAHYAGGVLGQGYGRVEGCSAENIDITVTPIAKGDSFDYGDKAGAIIGQHGEGVSYILNNTAKNVKIRGYRDIGGIIGMAHYGNTVKDNSVTDGTIIRDAVTNKYEDESKNAGEVIGRRGVKGELVVTEENNTFTNVTIKVITIADGVETDDAGNYTVSETSSIALENIIADINKNKFENAVILVDDGVEVQWECKYSDERTLILAENTTTKSITIKGKGNKSSFRAVGNGVRGVQSGNGKISFEDITVYDDTRYDAEDGNNAWEFAYLEWKGNIVCKNVIFADAIQPEGNDSVFEFTDCKFIADGNAKRDAAKQGNEYAAWISSGISSFTNCEFTGFRGPKIHEAYGTNVNSVIFDGCSFHDLTKKPGIAIGTVDATTIISIKNSTFTNCQAGDQNLYIYETDTPVTTFQFTEENNTVA